MTYGETRSDSPTLQVVGAEFPPYFTDKHKDHGILGLVLRAALSRHGYHLEFKVKPFARAVEEVKTGRADILAATYKTPEREVLFHFSYPIIESEVLLIKHSATDIHYQTLEDLVSYRIGKIRRSSSTLNIDQLSNLNIIQVNSYTQGLNMLLLDRIDLMIFNQLVLKHYLNSPSYSKKRSKLQTLTPALGKQKTYAAISKKINNHQALSNTLNTTLETLSMNGQLERMIESYLQSAYPADNDHKN
ncbi:hypothetical protein GCM10022277_35050 [Litoribacillus peritrichatus]|uniref:Solute-binding protein family 3/N-terminal domain-containing protein n=2 Tax=Litoribacillus peritrichatus TaxID=718191 RepID=A0ABP7N2S1_9GAMM